MQVGDLVKLLFTHHNKYLYGIVVEFDRVADGVLCFIEGENMWFSTNQLEVISASR